MINNAIYDAKYRKLLKILTPKQMLQILPIALAQVKAGNIPENLLNEIYQIIYFLPKCYYHIRYTFQSESILFSRLNA